MIALVAALALQGNQGAPTPAAKDAAPATATPRSDSKVDSVELVCLEHLDVGFTAAPQEIARREKEHLDHAIALCRERLDFRWTVESIWQLEQWLARTSERPARDEFVSLVKEGRIEVEAGYANLHTGVMDAEVVLRSFEPADAIRRELRITIDSAVQDDVPGFCALLPTAMRGSGVKYFLAGVNTSFGGGTSLGYDETPFWWEGLDGSRVLTWVARGSYVEAEKWGLGVWSKDEESAQTLEARLAELAQQKYPRSRFLLMASTGDNGDPNAARSILRKVDAWNAKHVGTNGPKVCFTTPGAFLREIEKNESGAATSSSPSSGSSATSSSGAAANADASPPKHTLTSHRGDWSGHWEPVKANAPAAMALYRDASALLPGAEALSLRASRELGLSYPQHDLDAALHQLLLYSEHSRPGGVGWPKLTTKDDVLADAQFTYALAFDAHETLTAIVRRVTDAYAQKLGADGACVVVANPTPFARGGEVEVGARRRHLPREVAGWSVERFGENQLADVDEAPLPGGEDGAASLVTSSGPLFVLRNLEHGGLVAPLDGDRDRIRPLRPVENRWSCELSILADRVPEPIADPLRLFECVAPFGGSVLPTGREHPNEPRPRCSLRFTTSAGVETAADFLPGSLPRSIATTGAVEIESKSEEFLARGGAAVATVLLREPFAFQTNAAAWLGASDLRDVDSLWIELLARGVRGETRDHGVVEFLELEPTLREPLRFHLDVTSQRVDRAERDDALSRARRDAELVHRAWAFRCPLVGRAYEPWFPTKREDVGTRPLVTTNASNVLVLQCRPATRLTNGAGVTEVDFDVAPYDVILQLQEVGGVAESRVAVEVALPDLTVARRCDLLERVAPDTPALGALPLAVTLRAHEVATFRLSRR